MDVRKQNKEDLSRMTQTDRNMWPRVVDEVRQMSGVAPFRNTLGLLEADFLDSEHLSVRYPRGLAVGHLDRLRQMLAEACRKVCGTGMQVTMQVDSGPQMALPLAGRAATDPDEQLRLNPYYTFDNFVVAPSNRLAHAACVAVCDAPGMAYNPLFLHGTVGLGKSHLLQATCHKMLERRPDINILYLSCESFVNQFIGSVERGELDQFRYRYRHVDVLVIDDINFLAEKDRTQEEFFHTFNTLYQSQRQVILSSDLPPQEIPNLQERLVSRFKWGLVARMDKPCFETRIAIVTKKARLRGVELPEEVVEFIARTVDSNVRELEGAVVRVTAQASLTGASMTIDLAREVLSDIIPRPSHEVTVPDIISAVIKRYNVKVSDLQGKKRNQSISLPRQVSMYLARRLTNLSLEEIGGYFGGRDHTTVLHAERKIEEMLRTDESLREALEALEQQVK